MNSNSNLPCGTRHKHGSRKMGHWLQDWQRGHMRCGCTSDSAVCSLSLLGCLLQFGDLRGTTDFVGSCVLSGWRRLPKAPRCDPGDLESKERVPLCRGLFEKITFCWEFRKLRELRVFSSSLRFSDGWLPRQGIWKPGRPHWTSPLASHTVPAI